MPRAKSFAGFRMGRDTIPMNGICTHHMQNVSAEELTPHSQQRPHELTASSLRRIISCNVYRAGASVEGGVACKQAILYHASGH
jgi:hypothetical protein